MRSCWSLLTEVLPLMSIISSYPRLVLGKVYFSSSKVSCLAQEHIVDIRALSRKDIPLVREMEEVGMKVLQEKTGQVDNVLTGFHWPIHSVGHLHMHIIAPADNMKFLSRIVFSRMFFGSTQAAIEMLEKK